MKLVTLKMPEELIEESGRSAKRLGVSRAEYIRRSVDRMNRYIQAEQRARRLAALSRRVRQESMRVNAEFARFESEPDA